METNWGKEAMKFARKEIPALLTGYTGKPESFFSALDKRWKDYCKALKKRMAELPKDDEAPVSEAPADSDAGDSDGDTDGPKK